MTLVALVTWNDTCCLGDFTWSLLHCEHDAGCQGELTLIYTACPGKPFFQWPKMNVAAVGTWPMSIFSSHMEPLSQYFPVMLHLSPATRILNENSALYT